MVVLDPREPLLLQHRLHAPPGKDGRSGVVALKDADEDAAANDLFRAFFVHERLLEVLVFDRITLILQNKGLLRRSQVYRPPA